MAISWLELVRLAEANKDSGDDDKADLAKGLLRLFEINKQNLREG